MSGIFSIDRLLNERAKKLKPGQSISFKIIKGSENTSSLEEVIENRDGSMINGENSNGMNGKSNENQIQNGINSSSSSSSSSTVVKNNNRNKKNIVPPLTFPAIAKFGESVVKPDFNKKLRNGRMYEQDVPKIKSDSDDDDDDENNPRAKKKRRFRRNEGPRRQWIIEPLVEYLNPHEYTNSTSSGRYIGLPESNLSHYILLSASPSDKTSLQAVPVHGHYSFAQPSRVAKMSMSDAEAAITNQRAHLTRYIMHGKLKDTPTQKNTGGGGGGGVGNSKSRLLGKLAKQNENDPDLDDNDVMGDVSFRNRRGTTARARKELLSDLGDENVTVDHDGVIGGANDAEFGGSRRFGRLHNNSNSQNSDKKKKKKHEAASSATTFEAAALQDDFYQRDVAAEYEDLDFNASEQFDDDDVDLQGDGTQSNIVENVGGNADQYDDDDFDDDYDDVSDSNTGLASSAGLKLMMAKARGENTEDPNANANNANGSNANGAVDSKGKKTTAYNRPDEPPGSVISKSASDGEQQSIMQNTPQSALQQVMNAASQAANKASEKKEKKKKASPADLASETTGVERDAKGQRLITLQAIRREIWLHHGQIRMKRLMKIFSIKNDPERYNRFRDLVKELCTMKVDKVEGNMLVLKQHWSNMG